jgi:hypothetical protein
MEVLDITVKTSCGRLNGTIGYPDPIASVTLSEYDTLQLGQSLTVSWSGSEADFYAIAVGYNWQVFEGDASYSWIDTFAVGNSVTFPGSIFVHHGEIYWIQVQAINGPFPGPGSVGNMIGNGSGFLYYYGQGIYHSVWIIVGSGSGLLMEMVPEKPSEKEIQRATKRKIETLIMGH